jgi:hypothetical protein
MSFNLDPLDTQPKYKLQCHTCGKISEHIQMNPKAWSGWSIVPVEECPECIKKALRAKGFEIQVGQMNGKVIYWLAKVGDQA